MNIFTKAILSVLLIVSISGRTQTVTLWSGSPGTYGNNQIATTPILTQYYEPYFMCLDPNNKMYISDELNHAIKLYDGTNVYTRVGYLGVAGGPGASGYVNASSINAKFNGPAGIVSDAAGNIYVCDQGNNCIRKITPFTTVGNSQSVTTFVGAPEPTGTPGFVDGTGTNARFANPTGICTDGTNFYVTDEDNNAIRKIVIATGVVTTVTGTASGAAGAFLDGTFAAAKFKYPRGIKYNAADNSLYVCDYGNKRVRKLNLTTSMVSTFAGTGTSGGTDGSLTVTQFRGPMDIVFDNFGNIFITDGFAANTIRKYTAATSQFSTICGSYNTQGTNDGQGSAARFDQPAGIIMNSAKTGLYVCDKTNHDIRFVDLQAHADFYALQTSLVTGGTTNLRDTSVNFPTTFSWTITPGVAGTDYLYISSTSTSQHPWVKFNTNGVYTVTHTATNAYGSSATYGSMTKTSYINVSSATGAPVADFTVNTTTGNPNTTSFTFTNLTTNASGCSYQWNFTPNTVSYVSSTQNDAQPTVKFGATGCYTVALTVNKSPYPADTKTKTNYICVFPAGINTNNAETLVNTIYPNPSNGNFKIDFADLEFNSAHVTIYDMNGKEVYSSSLNAKTSEIRMNSKAGIYFVMMEVDGKTATKKIIVN